MNFNYRNECFDLFSKYLVNVWFEQEGRTADFNVCDDGGYMSNMAQSYDGMVFSASLW